MQVIRVTSKRPPAAFKQASAALLRGTDDTMPVHGLQLSGLGSAINNVVAVATALEKEGLGRITGVKTAQTIVGRSPCAQMTVEVANMENNLVVSGEEITVRIDTAVTGERLTTASLCSGERVGALRKVAALAAKIPEFQVTLFFEASPLSIGKTLKSAGLGNGSIVSAIIRAGCSLLAVGSGDGSARLLDLYSGVCVQELAGHTKQVTGIRCSPDGTLVATASEDSTAKIWRVSDGSCLQTLRGKQPDAVRTLEFSPDGSLVLLSQRHGWGNGDAGVTIWRVSDGKLVHSLFEEGEMVGFGASWSPNGKQVACASGEFCGWVFSSEDGTLLKRLEGPGGDVATPMFSPDGKFLAIWSDRCIVLQVDGFEEVFRMEGGGDFCFSPDGSSLLCTPALGYGEDGVVVCGDEANAKIWDTAKRKYVQKLGQGNMKKGFVTSAVFSPDGAAVVATHHMEDLRIWCVADGRCLHTLAGHAATVVKFSPDGSFVATMDPNDEDGFSIRKGSGMIKVWSVDDGSCLQSFQLTASFKAKCIEFVPAPK